MRSIESSTTLSNRYEERTALGEEHARNNLMRLSNDYTILCDVLIEVDGKKSQLDFVVVGQTGIFVNEIKNLNGSITGREEDQQWRQDKVGRQGGNYSKSFYNPVKQVGTHVYRLSKLLQSHRINVWIQGVVYFTNPKTHVLVQTTKIPVYAQVEGGANEVISYIQDQHERKLTNQQVNDIVNVIVQQSNLKDAV